MNHKKEARMKSWPLKFTDWMVKPQRLMIILASMLVAILIGSVMPSLSTSSPSFLKAVIKNSIHIPSYAVLTFVVFLFFKQKRFFANEKRRALAAAAIFTFIFGVAIEVIQSFIPSRMADLFDVALNLWGILFFCVLVAYFWHRNDVIRRLSFQPTEREYGVMAQSKELMMMRERLVKFIDPEEAFILYIVSASPLEGKTTMAQALRRSLASVKPVTVLDQRLGIAQNGAGTAAVRIQDEAAFIRWIKQLRAKKELLVIDGEAVLTESHLLPSAVIAGAADYVLWVLAEGRNTPAQFSQARDLLAMPEDKPQGMVFNSIFC